MKEVGNLLGEATTEGIIQCYFIHLSPRGKQLIVIISLIYIFCWQTLFPVLSMSIFAVVLFTDFVVFSYGWPYTRGCGPGI